jgi:hypothetical protein
MLSKDVKPLVIEHEDDPKALWEALEFILLKVVVGLYHSHTLICILL